MTASPPHSPDSLPPPARLFAVRLAAILGSFLAFLDARARFLGAFAIPLYTRVNRAHRRLQRLLATLAAGRRPRTYPPRPARLHPDQTHPVHPTPRGPAIPRRRRWLFDLLRDDPLRHNAANHASQLAVLLGDPVTQSLLASAPQAALNSLGRTLRPLCRLLGIAVPAALALPARPRKPRPPRPPPIPREPPRHGKYTPAQIRRYSPGRIPAAAPRRA